jgi:anti-sigma B factor antagonist
MTTPVVVKRLPEQLKLKEIQILLHEVEPLFKASRPRIVFDCSQVNRMDRTGVDMLLYCLEQAIKQNGDLKLASITPMAAIVLEVTRVDRLFEVFETASAAVHSFSGPPAPGPAGPTHLVLGFV